MGIDVAWVDERGKAMQEVFDAQQCLTGLATSSWPALSGSVCLRFIDPWGDTVFNQAQVPVLLAELRAEVPHQSVAEVRVHLEKVVRLIEYAVESTLTRRSNGTRRNSCFESAREFVHHLVSARCRRAP